MLQLFLGVQALVQFTDQNAAMQARNSVQALYLLYLCIAVYIPDVHLIRFLTLVLQGRNIYDGCCTLDIQYSKYVI